MRLGIDFGTTRIVAAAADRGNFPLIPFDAGDVQFDWFPALVAVRGDERRYGWQAWQTQGEIGWTLIRSLKRYLDSAGPHTQIEADGQQIPITSLLVGLTTALREAIQSFAGAGVPLEVMLGIPANANSNQRFMTTDAFRSAGFEVLGMLNEPSAASIEFGHRQPGSGPARVLVYDLGGGTFDASLVERSGNAHTVLATASLPTLGGDDFDHLIARMALGEERLESLDAGALFQLEEECRRQKEALHPNSRRMVLDLEPVQEGLGTASVSVADFYEQCRPLVEQTVEVTQNLVADQEVDMLYITGGGSQLPLVARVLRETFGRKAKRSEYMRSATAIGLAIQADATTGYTLREVFTRNFGVWREANDGQTFVFDTIFPVGTRLPAQGEPPLVATRDYASAHNVGHFRYLEASELNEAGEPCGDMTLWDEILFPFDPALAEEKQLEKVGVVRGETTPQRIEELYECDSAGTASVTIRNFTAGYARHYQLGRWSEKPSVVKPSARKRTASARTKKAEKSSKARD